MMSFIFQQNSFQAIIASNGLFTFGIATYPQNGLQTLERFGGSWIARYDKQEQLYGFGKLIFDTLVIPTNTKNYGQVVVRIDSKQPIPLDVDQDGISDAEVNYFCKAYNGMCTSYDCLLGTSLVYALHVCRHAMYFS